MQKTVTPNSTQPSEEVMKIAIKTYRDICMVPQHWELAQEGMAKVELIAQALTAYGQSRADKVVRFVETMTNTCPVEGHINAPTMCPHWIMAQQEAVRAAKNGAINPSSKPK